MIDQWSMNTTCQTTFLFTKLSDISISIELIDKYADLRITIFPGREISNRFFVQIR